MQHLQNTFLPCAFIIALAALLFWRGPAAASPGLCAPVSWEPGSLGCATWRIVKSPNPGSSFSFLGGVATVSASDVWAVGDYSNSSGIEQTLVEQWNGTKWSVVKSPNVGQGDGLSGVASASASDVWAVGDYYNGSGPFQTLIEHWDGAKWSIVPSPNVRSANNILYNVAVVTASDIWAVGYYYDNTNSSTLIEHWDGTQWKVMPSPNAGSNSNFLNSVATVTASDVWAVGDYYNAKGSTQTLIEHWNGTRWKVVPSPNPGAGNNELSGVTVISSNNIWAVGSYVKALIEHWDGTTWRVVPSPNPGSLGNNLFGVAAISASDIWAVGDYYNNYFYNFKTLTEHWDGQKWHTVKSPNIQQQPNFLNGVAGISATNIWAVGFYGNQYTSQTLTEHYS